jgi:hypothetical protein
MLGDGDGTSEMFVDTLGSLIAIYADKPKLVTVIVL